MTKKKRKVMFKATDSSQFDRNDILIYEEVARMPPFNRKTLVLIGARGIGRRALKEKLVQSDKKRFAGVIPRAYFSATLESDVAFLFFTVVHPCRHVTTAPTGRGGGRLVLLCAS